MRTRTVVIPSVMLAIAVCLWADPLAAQRTQSSRSHEAAHEVYAPSLTPAIYLVNFLLLYMANPDIAAYMPAYKAPIPEPVVDCLEQNPTGCPYADYRQYFENPHGGGDRNRECFWPDVCQENRRNGRAWRHANSDRLETSTSHWGGGGQTSSLTSLAWTRV